MRSVKGKVIFKAVTSVLLLGMVLYTIVGIVRCKNVDKVSNALIFRYNEDASVTTLDPAYVKSQSELWITSQIFNGLIDLDSNLLPIPMLAQKWNVSASGLEYTFFLRRDVYFNRQGDTGSAHSTLVTASDVVYSFRRLLDPKVASPGAWIFSDKILLENLQLPADDPRQPFQAMNDSVFVLRLKQPFSAMLPLLATAYCYIVPSKIAGLSGNNFGRQPVGTGPFYLKLWEEDVKLVLRRNARYFEFDSAHRLPYLEAVNIDFIKNKQTAFMRFSAGEYDFFNGIEGSFKDELLTKNGELKPDVKGKYQMLQKPFLNTEYMGFWIDTAVEVYPYLCNIHLRKALNLAIDRKTIVKYLRNGVGEIGVHGFVPPALLQYPVAGYLYNPTQARRELLLAGYENGRGIPPLVITTTADYLDMAVYVKKYWEEIGLKVRIDVQTGGMLRQMRNKGKLPIFRGSWIADYADAENYLACFYSKNHSPSGPNYTHYTSPAFDQLYDQLSAESRPEKRQQIIHAADSVLSSEAPFVVLYYDKSIRLYQNNVIGLGNDALNRLNLKKVRKQ